MKFTFPFLFVFYMTIQVEAGENDSSNSFAPLLPYDDNYVQGLSKWITLKTFFIFDGTILQIKSDKYESIPKYSPNLPVKIGFGFSYKWIGLGFAVKYPFAKDNSEKKGITTGFELNLNTYGRWLAIDANVQRYQGIYLRNPRTIYPAWQNGDPFPQRDDVSVASAGVNVIIVANPLKYSLKAATTYSEIQEKSAGSFIIAPFINYIGIRGDHSLVAGEMNSIVNSDEKMIDGDFFSTGILPGYAFNLVSNGIFFSTIINGGAAIQFQFYSDVVDDKNRKAKLIFKPMIRTTIGYNSRKFFAALSGQYEIYKQPISGTHYDYVLGLFRLSFGVRFNVNKSE